MNDSLKILFFTYCFPPETSGHALLMHQLTAGLSDRGHRVTVVTGFPGHGSGHIESKYGGKLFSVEETNSVRVVRNLSYSSSKKTFATRSINFLSFSLTTLLGGMRTGKADAVYVYSPPLPFAATAALVARVKSAPLVTNVQDVYPDAAINTGYISEGGLVARGLGLMERFVYNNSAAISVICDSFAQNVSAKLGGSEKVVVISNWIDTDKIAPVDRANDFSRKHGLENKFVVLYAGTIGLTSGARYLLECAEYFRNDGDIHFLFIGEGVVKAAMQKESERRRIPNVTFLPFQPEEILPQVLGTGDVCLVTLGPKAGRSSMPLKTLSIMSAGRPVLAATGLEGDVARLVEKAGCGIVCRSQDTEQLCNTVEKLKNNKDMRLRMGRASREYAIRHFGVEKAVDSYEQLFRKVRHAAGRSRS